jgi:hypothetical protein
LIAYAIAASAYRVLVVLGICTMLALTVPVAGVGLALFYAFTAVRDAVKQLREFLKNSREAAPHRARAIAVFGALGLIVPLAMLCVPLPWSRHAVGIVARDQDRVLRAEASGFLKQLFVQEGDQLAPGQEIAALENAEATAVLRSVRAECARLRIELRGSLQTNHAEAAPIAARLAQAERELAAAERTVNELTIRTAEGGVVMNVATLDDEGRFLEVGEPVAEIGRGQWVIRALLNSEGYAAAHPAVGQPVTARLHSAGTLDVTGKILRVAAAGERRVEETALTHLGGGEIAVRPETMEAIEPFYEVTIALNSAHIPLQSGVTASVKFPPQTEALGMRIYRGALRFLNRLRASV